MSVEHPRGSEGYIEEILRLLNLAHQLHTTLQNRCAELFGMSLQQIVALNHVEESGGTTVSDLAGRLVRSNHTVTAMLDRLEEMGLVVRRRDLGQDRRRVWVHITEAGRSKVAEYRRAMGRLEEAVLGILDDDGRGRVQEAIGTLRKLLG